MPDELIDSIWFIIDLDLKGVIPLENILTFDLIENRGKVTMHFSQAGSNVEMDIDLPFGRILEQEIGSNRQTANQYPFPHCFLLEKNASSLFHDFRSNQRLIYRCIFLKQEAMWKWILICRLPIRTNFLLKYTPMMTVREKRSFYQVRSDNIKVHPRLSITLILSDLTW